MKKLTVFAISHFIAHTEHNMSELREWQTLANKELSRRETTVDALVKQTAEGIDVKPLYTEADLDNLEVTGTLPGLPPYVRGPRATMYTAQPPVRRFLYRQRVQRFLSPQPRRGAERAFRRLRPRDPPGL